MSKYPLSPILSAEFWQQFFPTYCLLCQKLSSNTLCSECHLKLKPIKTPHCLRCTRIMPEKNMICGACLDSPLDTFCSAYLFEESAREIILKGKYSADRKALAFMAQSLTPHIKNKFDKIIPMPISKPRLIQRGFNQTHIIGKDLAKQTGIALDKTLISKKHRKAQSSLEHKARQKNIRGAFSMISACQGQKLILLDDVCTTASTLKEAARTLKRAGAQEIHAFVFAAVQN